MACPYLAYRTGDDERTFDEARAYCTVVDRFVQPMRADVCNDRYDLNHADHCEIYREAESRGGEEDEDEATDGRAAGTERAEEP